MNECDRSGMVRDEARKSAYSFLDLHQLQPTTRQPDGMGTAATGVKETHRSPEDTILACGYLQKLLVGTYRDTDNHKEAAVRDIPLDALIGTNRLREVPMKGIQQAMQIVPVKSDLLLVGSAQAAPGLDQYPADDGLRDW